MLIAAKLSSKAHVGQTAYKIFYNNLCIKVREKKSSASESKPFQNRSKDEIPCRARRKKKRLSRSKLKKAFVIDSDAEPVSCA